MYEPEFQLGLRIELVVFFQRPLRNDSSQMHVRVSTVAKD